MREYALAYRVLNSTDGFEAKRISREAPQRLPGFRETFCVNLLYKLVRVKLDANPEFYAFLYQRAQGVWYEATQDTFWGVGRSYNECVAGNIDPSEFTGQNRFGQILRDAYTDHHLLWAGATRWFTNYSLADPTEAIASGVKN